MHLTLLRHGKTEWGLTKKISGWEDIPLHEVGIAECKALLPQMTGKYEAIYTSPLKRAAQSAAIFAEQLGVPVIEDPDLRERNFGSLVGQTWEWVHATYGSWKK